MMTDGKDEWMGVWHCNWLVYGCMAALWRVNGKEKPLMDGDGYHE